MFRTLKLSLPVMAVVIGLGTMASAVTAPGSKEEPGDNMASGPESPVFPSKMSDPPVPVSSGFAVLPVILPEQALPSVTIPGEFRFDDEYEEVVAAPVPGSALLLLTAIAGLVLIHRRHVRAMGEMAR